MYAANKLFCVLPDLPDHELFVMLVANVCFGENIMSCIQGMAVCKIHATAAGQHVCCEMAACLCHLQYYSIRLLFHQCMKDMSCSVVVFSSWLHIASRLQGYLQQDGLWQALLLSLLHCLVDMFRCSASNLMCCVDAGRGIQGRRGSQRGQDA